MKKVAAILFDLDNCLYDDAWRLDRIRYDEVSQTTDYLAYHQGIRQDEIIPHAKEIVQDAMDKGVFVFFVTARPRAFYDVTLSKLKDDFYGWLDGVDYSLVMRPDDDHRPSPEYKGQAAREAIDVVASLGSKVIAGFDDRQDVLDAYLAAGVPAVFLCDRERCDAGPLTVITPEPVVQPKPSASFESAPLDEAPVFPDAMGIEELFNKSYDTGSRLEAMAATFRERNAEYKDNGKLVADLMQAMFPEGFAIDEKAGHEFWHLFNLMIVKLSRFVKSGLKHQDSIHDLAIYAAMLDGLLERAKSDTIASHQIKVFN